MSVLRFEIGKNYHYKHDKKVYRLDWITPQEKALPSIDVVLYLSRRGEGMMGVPLALAPQLLVLYEGPDVAGTIGGIEGDDPLDA